MGLVAMKTREYTETLLVVDDEEDLVTLTAGVLDRAGYEALCATSLTDATSRLSESFTDLILIDERLGRESGTKFLDEVHRRHPGLTGIVISGHADLALAQRAMQAGAAGILAKPAGEDELLEMVRRALDNTELLREARRNRWMAQRTARPPEIVGESQAIRDVLETVGQVASSNSAVLIQGESGTGKELIAKAIHLASPRKHKAMVSVNMGALARDLVAPKLFGSVRGSYTGAVEDRKGVFEEAQGSTLFMDEIGEAPLDVQAHLLRSLEARTVVRVGENIERKVDVRVVAASNRNLSKDVQSGRFRQDLFFRLNVVPIVVPALRERPEDIEPIANHLLAGLVRDNGRAIRNFAPEAIRKLRQYPWPGNVRELRNVVERAVLLAHGSAIAASDLRLEPGESPSPELAELFEKPFEVASAAFERVYFQRLLQRSLGKKTKAADLAGLDRSTIYNYLKKLGLSAND